MRFCLNKVMDVPLLLPQGLRIDMKKFISKFSFLMVAACTAGCGHESSDYFLDTMSSMAYGSVLSYDALDNNSLDDRLVVAKSVSARSLILFAGVLMEQSVDLDEAPAQASVTLCYLSNNYEEISSHVVSDIGELRFLKTHLKDIKNFLDENNEKIMSYTKFAKYSKDKTDCYIPGVGGG